MVREFFSAVRKESKMLTITQVGRVMVPVTDQDEAIEFYTKKLGFSLAADVPFGDGERWVEVTPPAGGTNLSWCLHRVRSRPGR
jgi:catechol 2,3-dioxygenase-like lactoylglutathione lyase family enzyme